MGTENFKARDVQPTVLRMHPDLRVALMRLAKINGRSLSKEIETRLRESLDREAEETVAGATAGNKKANALQINYAPVGHITPANAETPNLNNRLVLTPSDHAMLEIFRGMPYDKQLALLSLFK